MHSLATVKIACTLLVVHISEESTKWTQLRAKNNYRDKELLVDIKSRGIVCSRALEI